MEKPNETNIEELFRRKLENAEIVPGSSVNSELMRKLGRKEFLRFNPARFNIYYVALIVAAAVTAGIILFSKPSTVKEEPPSSVIIRQTETPAAAPQSNIIAPAIKQGKTISAKTIIDPVTAEQSVSVKNTESVRSKSEEPISAAEVKTAIPDKVITGEKESQTVKLREPAIGNGAMFVPSVTAGCAPLKVYFDNLAGSFEEFSWTFGDGGTSDKSEPVWIYEREGEYKVSLVGTDRDGETATYSSFITVFPKPKALFETTPANAVIPDDEITFLNNSTGAIAYKWDFGDGTTSSIFEPKHRYSKFDKYIINLTVTSENGCSDKFTYADAFSGSGFFIRMPNAFIPNPQGPSGGIYSSKSDESAEIFHPVSSGVAEFRVQVFSKIGILLFESNDINTGWDGYFKGQLCNPGVYIWKATGRFINGEPFLKSGDVTLLKN